MSAIATALGRAPLVAKGEPAAAAKEAVTTALTVPLIVMSSAVSVMSPPLLVMLPALTVSARDRSSPRSPRLAVSVVMLFVALMSIVAIDEAPGVPLL